MAFRLLRYMVRIWEAERPPLPAIVPIVLHHSESGWRSPTSLHDLVALEPLVGTGIEALVPSFRFVLDDLSQQTDEAMAERVGDALARLVLSVLRDARGAKDGAEVVGRLGALLREGLREAYGRVLAYLLTVMRPEPRPFLDALAREVGRDAEEEAMGMLDAIREEGRAEGLAQGMQQGMQEGIAVGELAARRRMLGRLLAAKLGPLPAAVEAAIAGMDGPALDDALVRVIHAERIEDVLSSH